MKNSVREIPEIMAEILTECDSECHGDLMHWAENVAKHKCHPLVNVIDALYTAIHHAN